MCKKRKAIPSPTTSNASRGADFTIAIKIADKVLRKLSFQPSSIAESRKINTIAKNKRPTAVIAIRCDGTDFNIKIILRRANNSMFINILKFILYSHYLS